jgi:hypothetical protein
MDYPPNSDKSKAPPREEKEVERVTSADPIRRKPGLGKRFGSTFFGGDARTAAQYMIFNVLIPAAKDALADAGAQGIERLIFGDSRAKKRSSQPSSGATGYVSYNRYSMGGQPREDPQRTITRRARAQHDFDEIVLQSRNEAEVVLERLFDLLSKYDSVSVSDLYSLVGLPANHTDHKWGWTELRGADVSRVRNGFLLDLPEPQPLA